VHLFEPMTMKKIPVEQINSQEMSGLPILYVNLLGRRITFMTVSDIINTISTACVEKKKIVIANYNVHK